MCDTLVHDTVLMFTTISKMIGCPLLVVVTIKVLISRKNPY